MSFPAYQSYRESGIAWLGSIPASWNLERLKHVAKLNPSKSEVAHLAEDVELSFLPMEAISETGELDTSRTRPLFEVKNGYSYFADGDVAFAKVTPCFENGKGALMESLVGGCGFGTTELTVLRPYHPGDAHFLRWLIFSDLFRGPGAGEMQGAGGLKRVPDDFVASFPVPWPSMSERHAIAAFLDRETAKIDALVEEQRRLIELLKEKRQAVISHAVTKGLDPTVPLKDSGVEWLGRVPAHWEVKPLKQLAAAGTSITYGIVQAGPDIPDGVPYIRTSDMSGDELPEDGYLRTSPEIDQAYARSKVRAGDLVIAIRATIGKPMMVPPSLEGANLTQGTAKFSPGAAVNGRYIQLVLGSAEANKEFERIAKGATFKEITLDMLRRFRVPVPPLEEQCAISDWAEGPGNALAGLETGATEAEALLKERRAALISAAVTGKIDVRSAVSQQAEAA